LRFLVLSGDASQSCPDPFCVRLLLIDLWSAQSCAQVLSSI
jgi:hypothetical protein